VSKNSLLSSQLNSQSGTIISPRWPDKSDDYTLTTSCDWDITTNEDYLIQLNVMDLDFPSTSFWMVSCNSKLTIDGIIYYILLLFIGTPNS